MAISNWVDEDCESAIGCDLIQPPQANSKKSSQGSWSMFIDCRKSDASDLRGRRKEKIVIKKSLNDSIAIV